MTAIPENAPPRLTRPRGRPALMTAPAVFDRIQELAARGALFRVHRTHGRLYARARRQFGSWAGAVRAAGVDYRQAVAHARARSLESRRRRSPNLPSDNGFAG
jgi:hypothetical protein